MYRIIPLVMLLLCSLLIGCKWSSHSKNNLNVDSVEKVGTDSEVSLGSQDEINKETETDTTSSNASDDNTNNPKNTGSESPSDSDENEPDENEQEQFCGIEVSTVSSCEACLDQHCCSQQKACADESGCLEEAKCIASLPDNNDLFGIYVCTAKDKEDVDLSAIEGSAGFLLGLCMFDKCDVCYPEKSATGDASVSVSVEGLTGEITVSLQPSEASPLVFDKDGEQVFDGKLDIGTEFRVSIDENTSNNCIVKDGEGVVENSDITVEVRCDDNLIRPVLGEVVDLSKLITTNSAAAWNHGTVWGYPLIDNGKVYKATSEGALDFSFGADGVVELHGIDDSFKQTDIEIGSGGDIFVFGFVTTGLFEADTVVFHLDSKGQIKRRIEMPDLFTAGDIDVDDNYFVMGSDGLVSGSDSFYYSETITGTESNLTSVLRFRSGEFDPVYSDNGRTIIESPLRNYRLMSHQGEKLLLAGHVFQSKSCYHNETSCGDIIRLRSDGAIDETFRCDFALLEIDHISDMVVLPDDSIVLVDFPFPSLGARLTKLTKDCAYVKEVTLFSHLGQLSHYSHLVDVTDDGKLLFAISEDHYTQNSKGGTTHYIDRMYVARLNGNLEMDETFHGNGQTNIQWCWHSQEGDLHSFVYPVSLVSGPNGRVRLGVTVTQGWKFNFYNEIYEMKGPAAYSVVEL